MKLASIVALSALLSCAFHAKALNPIQIENGNAGTTNWQLTNPATDREIEGYASATSVNIGGTLTFYVSVKNPFSDTQATYEIYRMGWYGGSGGRLISTAPGPDHTLTQPMPTMDPQFGTFDCNWTASLTMGIPSNWVSGFYLMKLTALPSGKQSYIIFVVRDDARISDFLFQSSVTTYQAYNNWPGYPDGKSFYGNSSQGIGAIKVSFNRPYAISNNPMVSNPASQNGRFGVGAGEFLITLNHKDYTTARGQEYNMVRFLEKEGYDVTYNTNLDTHRDGLSLLRHKAFLSVGHDEYWSMQMRSHVENALARGVNAAFFSANTSYWQVRFEPSSNGQGDRVMVGFKDRQTDYLGNEEPTQCLITTNNDYSETTRYLDPADNICKSRIASGKRMLNCPLKTTLFSDPSVGLPENLMMGVSVVGLFYQQPANHYSADIVVSDASHWAYTSTGLQNGDHLPFLAGYEVDGITCGSPPNVARLAHSPIAAGSCDGTAPTTVCTDMVTRIADSGARVFSTGSIQWSWGLDDYSADEANLCQYPSCQNTCSGSPTWPHLCNTKAQQITRNVLNGFRGTPRTDLFIKGSDGAIWYGAYNAVRTWQGWTSLGGGFHSGPATATRGSNELHVFGFSLDDKLWEIVWNGASWGTWRMVAAGAPPGLTLTFDPAAISNGLGEIDVYARASDSNIWRISMTAGTWGSWSTIAPGAFHSGPAAVASGAGRVDVFAVAVDDSLYTNSWNGTQWNPNWTGLTYPPGTRPDGSQLKFSSNPTAVSWGGGRIDVFVRDNQMQRTSTSPVRDTPRPGIWQKTFSGGVWQAWNALPGGYATGHDCDHYGHPSDGVDTVTPPTEEWWGPAATSFGPNDLNVFAVAPITSPGVIGSSKCKLWKMHSTDGLTWQGLAPVADYLPNSLTFYSDASALSWYSN